MWLITNNLQDYGDHRIVLDVAGGRWPAAEQLPLKDVWDNSLVKVWKSSNKDISKISIYRS